MSVSKRRSTVNNWILFLLVVGACLFIYYQSENVKEKKNVALPTKLHPVVEKDKDELIKRAKARGISIVITDGFRTFDDQDKLYAKGRSEKGDIVTTVRGGESYHNYGLAIDFALRTANGDVVWDLQRDSNRNGKADWMEVVAIAKDLGFSWGGDWEFKDYPHLQKDFGLSIEDLKNGERPPEQE
ncbi:M15 family metallopeptidase [Fictibacillus enclensis]|uniref:M15 family metallopeptidase n=1 Tax=Fictibacillus enclensis TaxID=1017270 RepID=UPI0024C0D681|nr:M15 family metallopeptidase [Fictibacillus enclensis]WHY73028.1 M15 family metallopeptidase [Fictibacillus enclensis]